MSLDPDIAKILKDCGLGRDALWTHKQSGKLIMYHWACEKAGAAKRIWWEKPEVIVADPASKIAVVLVTGRMGEASEWSFGEAAPYNTTQTYPFAMAEKRAKDRVILKLLGLHGQVYSDAESDDFQRPAEPAAPAPQVNGAWPYAALEDAGQFLLDLDERVSLAAPSELSAMLKSNAPTIKRIEAEHPTLADAIGALREKCGKLMGKAA